MAQVITAWCEDCHLSWHSNSCKHPKHNAYKHAIRTGHRTKGKVEQTFQFGKGS